MNRVLVAGIAGFAMLVSAGFTSQDCYAGRKCGGGGLLSGLGGSRCGGQVHRERSGCGLLAKLKAGRNDCGCPAPAPSCCPEPAPVCCEAPAPTCCEAPAPTCCSAPAPTCGCSAPAPSCGCESMVSSGCNSCGGGVMMSSSSYVGGTVMSSNCPNCSQTFDSGVIMESSAPSSAPPSSAPPAPTPVPDSASDAPSA